MKLEIRTLLAMLSIALSAGACSDDEETPPSPDCTEVADTPLNWRPIGKIATGSVAATTADGVTTAVIDGTAGGFMNAADNPYIYVDLKTGTRVDVSDVDAMTDTRWHIAFKRASIRINGGDSGAGGVTAAKVPAASLAEVTAAPAETEFATDDWASDACVFQKNEVGEPASLLSDWYVYDQTTHRITGAKPFVYVLKAGGATIKVRIVSYYDAQNTSAMYKVEWASL